MFCEKCGNKVNDDWIRCPECGAELKKGEDNIPTIQKKTKKKSKVKKPIFKKVWFWILVIIVAVVAFSLMSGSGENQEKSKDVQQQDIVDLEAIGGFAGWSENDFAQKVRAVVTVYLPLENTDINNYVITVDGNPIRVMQEDETPVSEWDWLESIDEAGAGAEYVLYEATLEYLGQKETDELPVFLISDVQLYGE